uniref:hypothetical protein n=1 Tax=Nocardia brasiliensis TaxID=37326 RepID=UPI0024572728
WVFVSTLGNECGVADGYPWSRLRQVFASGEALPAPTAARLRELTGARLAAPGPPPPAPPRAPLPPYTPRPPAAPPPRPPPPRPPPAPRTDTCPPNSRNRLVHPSARWSRARIARA